MTLTWGDLRALYRRLQADLAGFEHGEHGRYVIHNIDEADTREHEGGEAGLCCWCRPTILAYPEDFRDLGATMRRLHREGRPH